MRPSLVLFLLLTAPLPALELRLEIEGWLRPPLLLPVRVSASATAIEPGAGPLRLRLSLRQGARPLAGHEEALTHLGQLADGVRVALAPAALGDRGGQVTLEAELLSDDPRLRASRSCEPPNPEALARELAACADRLRSLGRDEPLAWLWLEQATELLRSPLPRLGELDRAQALVGRVEGGLAEGRFWEIGASAWRDPVDGSVQPYRTRPGLPSGPAHGVLLLRPATGDRKSSWPDPAPDTRGLALLEPYPAGDRDGGGALRRRAAALARGGRWVVAGAGPMREAAALVAGDLGLPLLPGDAADPGFDWLGSGLPATAAPPVGGLIPRYADAPFVIVVGTGEHAAAARANRELGAAFRAAWAAHAHGVPPLVEDQAFRAEAFPDHHLVCIGNPRSNRVLEGFALSWPVQWSLRELTWPGGSALRVERRPVAAALPRPGVPDRVVVLLDGAPAWQATGLPLADLGDLHVGGTGR